MTKPSHMSSMLIPIVFGVASIAFGAACRHTGAQSTTQPRPQRNAQPIDTLVDVGGYRLHFNVMPGKGMPILFESGGGDDGTVWIPLLKQISESLGTTLITYDRAGFGKSQIDTNQHGIVNGIQGLEIGLKSLGFTGEIMLVAHSLGGFYATLYASRHPNEIKTAVFIDTNTSCFFTDEFIRKEEDKIKSKMEEFKRDNVGVYYIYGDLQATVDIMRKTAFPSHISVIDIVAERTPFEGTPDAERWKACHRQFVDASPNRQGIMAHGSGHYVFQEKRELVIDAIVKAYKDAVTKAL